MRDEGGEALGEEGFSEDMKDLLFDRVGELGVVREPERDSSGAGPEYLKAEDDKGIVDDDGDDKEGELGLEFLRVGMYEDDLLEMNRHGSGSGKYPCFSSVVVPFACSPSSAVARPESLPLPLPSSSS